VGRSHPESIRVYRQEERRQAADRKRFRRAVRRTKASLTGDRIALPPRPHRRLGQRVADHGRQSSGHLGSRRAKVWEASLKLIHADACFSLSLQFVARQPMTLGPEGPLNDPCEHTASKQTAGHHQPNYGTGCPNSVRFDCCNTPHRMAV